MQAGIAATHLTAPVPRAVLFLAVRATRDTGIRTWAFPHGTLHLDATPGAAIHRASWRKPWPPSTERPSAPSWPSPRSTSWSIA